MAELLLVKPEMGQLARVVEWVDDLVDRWGITQSTAFAMHLCFEEAVSNIILHKECGEACQHDVRLSVEQEKDSVVVTIEDRGSAFDPLAVPAPTAPNSIEEASIGGLGIHLVRQFARDMAYERRGDLNRLTLCFDLAKTLN